MPGPVAGVQRVTGCSKGLNTATTRIDCSVIQPVTPIRTKDHAGILRVGLVRKASCAWAQQNFIGREFIHCAIFVDKSVGKRAWSFAFEAAPARGFAPPRSSW